MTKGTEWTEDTNRTQEHVGVSAPIRIAEARWNFPSQSPIQPSVNFQLHRVERRFECFIFVHIKLYYFLLYRSVNQ